MIKIKKSSTCIVGYQTLLQFQLAQHSRNFALMGSIISYLNCGVVSEHKEIVIFRRQTMFAALNYQILMIK
jgi:hypothetical protein